MRNLQDRAKRVALLKHNELPVFNLDTNRAVFNPGMAKRNGSGPFDVAPIIQGRWDGSGVPDSVQFPRGNLIYGVWYENYDPYQGGVTCWVTPEWDGDDGLDHVILDGGSINDGILIYKNDDGTLRFFLGGKAAPYVDISAWTAGTRYFLAFRWDAKNPLDGTNYLCTTIDASHNFGATVQPNIDAPPSEGLFIGGLGNPADRAFDGLIEGLTIYRRPPFDGTYGIDLGNGDELELIRNGGAGEDPCLVTKGSWGIIFCLPTDSTAEEMALVSGVGEAWSHPHSSAVLVDGFCQTTWASSGWSTEGTPSSGPANLVDTEKIFLRGYKWTCDAANEGITQTISSLTVGQDYVLRAIAHCVSAAAIRVRIWDETNDAQIGADFDFGPSSSRTAPGIASFTFELPTVARNGVASDCVSISVKVLGLVNTQEVFCHQVELQENELDGSSMETWAAANEPDGWTEQFIDGGDISEENVMVHSGIASAQYGTGEDVSEGMWQSYTPPIGTFFSWGAWFWGTGQSDNLRLETYDVTRAPYHSRAEFRLSIDQGNSWAHYSTVRRAGDGNDTTPQIMAGNVTPSGNRYIDDAYVFALDPVSLTIVPADKTGCTENGGLRVGGRNTLVQTIPVRHLGAKSGKIRFNWIPRHGSGNFANFGISTPSIFQAHKDPDNYILLSHLLADRITLEIKAGAINPIVFWRTNVGDIVAGTQYHIEIEYDLAKITFSVDRVVKITVTPGAGIDFGENIPDIAYFGCSLSLIKQNDAVFANPH